MQLFDLTSSSLSLTETRVEHDQSKSQSSEVRQITDMQYIHDQLYQSPLISDGSEINVLVTSSKA